MKENNSRRKFFGYMAAAASIPIVGTGCSWLEDRVNKYKEEYKKADKEDKPKLEKLEKLEKPKNNKTYLILDSGHGGLESGATLIPNKLGIKELSKYAEFTDTIKCKIKGTTNGLYKKLVPKKWRDKAESISEKVKGTIDPAVNKIREKLPCIYEDEISYDILARIMTLNKTRSNKCNFEILPIVKDIGSGYTPKEKLVSDMNEYVFNPINGYSSKMQKKSHNLPERIKVIKQIYTHLLNVEGANPDNIYFMSVHVNSENYKNKGAFAVYPGKERYKDNIAEAKSKKFGEGLIGVLRDNGVNLHGKAAYLGYGDIAKQKFLLYNAEDRDIMLALFNKTPKIKKKIFLECGNMKNFTDVNQLNNPSYRDNIAEGILKYIDNISRPKLEVAKR